MWKLGLARAPDKGETPDVGRRAACARCRRGWMASPQPARVGLVEGSVHVRRQLAPFCLPGSPAISGDGSSLPLAPKSHNRPMHRSELESLLIAELEPSAGPVGSAAASALLHLARDLGTDIVRGAPSWSFRLAGAPAAPTREITLFLISTKGTFWIRWLDRWEKAGVRPGVATQYEQGLATLLGRNVLGRQMHTQKAVDLRKVAKHLDALRPIIRETVEAMRATGAGRPLA
jgi:hypothetical protein